MPVNTIAKPCSSAAAITSSSRILPPGWITHVAPADAAASMPSAKGKKASEATSRVNAAHLTRTNAGCCAVFDIDNRVGFDMFGDFPRHAQVGHLGLCRGAFCDDFQIFIRNITIITVLDEDTARDIALRHGGCRHIR